MSLQTKTVDTRRQKITAAYFLPPQFLFHLKTSTVNSWNVCNRKLRRSIFFSVVQPLWERKREKKIVRENGLAFQSTAVCLSYSFDSEVFDSRSFELKSERRRLITFYRQ